MAHELDLLDAGIETDYFYCMPTRKTKLIELGGQTLMHLENMEASKKMPLCEKTGTNVDLHLVACKDPDTGGFTASVLGADYRHLVRRTTTLSIPIWILSVGSIRALEERKKIPAGSEAVGKLKVWLRHDVDSSWKEIAEARHIHQEALDLEDAAGLGF
jgi:hypothetical protein